MRNGRARRLRVRLRIAAALTICAVCFTALSAVARAADLTATPTTLSSVFGSAKGGDRILLASGDYGTFKGGSKTSMVTITPQTGATPVMKLALNPASYITFDGLTINGG